MIMSDLRVHLYYILYIFTYIVTRQYINNIDLYVKYPKILFSTAAAFPSPKFSMDPLFSKAGDAAEYKVKH